MLYSFLNLLRSPRNAVVAAIFLVATSACVCFFCVYTSPISDRKLTESKRKYLTHSSQPAPPIASPNEPQAPTEAQAFDQAKLAFDQARYEDSLSHLEKMGLSTPEDYRQILNQGFRFMVERQPKIADPLFHKAQLGAMALAYSGKRSEANEVFAETLQRIARLRRINDLTHQMATAVNRPEIELERSKLLSVDSIAPASKPPFAELGRRLYSEKCAHCHGETGAGNGRAARHLFPLPRNFVGQRFRYVSSTNGLANDSDLTEVIRLGLPGSSMPAFPELSDSEVQLLLPVIREFHRGGVEARFKGLANSKQELEDLVLAKTQPNKQLDVPDLPQESEAAVRRGELLFQSTGCRECHSPNNLAGQTKVRKNLYDESGQPILARDFSSDPLKGGSSINEIYYRIALGIPGTPHPSLAANPSDTLDLALYILSIAGEAKATSTNAMRSHRLMEAESLAR